MRMITKIITGLLLTVACFGNELPKRNSPSAPLDKSEHVTLLGLVIVPDFNSVKTVSKTSVQGVRIENERGMPSSDALQKKLIPWIGKTEITRSNLLAIKNEILSYYAERQQSLITVEIPEQDITSGVVTIIVMQAKVGQVQYCGNRWFSQKRVAKKLPIAEGAPLNEKELLNDLAWLNENPFHYTEVVLSPGSMKGSTNLELVTKDRFPLRVYSGGDNTGIESTGTSRFYGGLTWGDAFFCR